MVIFDAIGSFFVSVLVAYLGITNALAERIEQALPPNDAVPEEVAYGEMAHTESQAVSSELLTLSRSLGGGSIVSLLKENPEYRNSLLSLPQEATVVEALDTTPTPPLADSLVNILCEYSTSEFTRTTTGSGVFVGDTGVILTNAHVAQFLLLEGMDEKITDASCVIRTGDPAIPRYVAKLLFISPTWILENAKLITEETPRGTGEYDYALLYIAETLDGSLLPKSFPALPLHTALLPRTLKGEVVDIGGYPAERLHREGPKATLPAEVATVTIKELYTFGSNYADVFSLAGSRVGEHGSSGGPVVKPGAGLIGLIVTKGDPVTDGDHSLRALTLSYIDRTIQEETGFGIAMHVQGNLDEREKLFRRTLSPFLSQLIAFEL